jgi:hypothetical protein
MHKYSPPKRDLQDVDASEGIAVQSSAGILLIIGWMTLHPVGNQPPATNVHVPQQYQTQPDWAEHGPSLIPKISSSAIFARTGKSGVRLRGLNPLVFLIPQSQNGGLFSPEDNFPKGPCFISSIPTATPQQYSHLRSP